MWRYPNLHNQIFASTGFLIGVKGQFWSFSEYNILVGKNEGAIGYKVYTIPFLHYDDLLATPYGQRDYEPSQYAQRNLETYEGFELDATRDLGKMATILKWIDHSGQTRNLIHLSDQDRSDQIQICFVARCNPPLSYSLSHSSHEKRCTSI